jgi:hypothetical protein
MDFVANKYPDKPIEIVANKPTNTKIIMKNIFVSL